MLLFLFIDTWWAALATVLGLVVCTIVTLAPLSRRKAIESVAQSMDADAAEAAVAARFDPLDAASEPGAEPSDSAAAAALDLLQKKEGSA
jgi:UDP-GlcNAc:undecaprenyl-phosphate GlcNAc-1-phosphate transferase